MTLSEFIKLPPEHNISFDEGCKLHLDICAQGVIAVPDEQRQCLRDYLNNILLYGAVEPPLREQLEDIYTDLASASQDNLESN